MKFVITLVMLLEFGTIHKSYATKTTLHVGVLLELTEYWFRKYTSFFVKTLEYVFASIDQRSDILGEFEFKLIVRDTKGHNGIAAAQLIDLVKTGEPKVAIIGPTRSGSLTVTGQISPVFNVMQLSCIAITAATVDRALYPTLIKVNQASNLLNPLRIKMMKHFGWTRVGTIIYQDDISISQMSSFHQLLQDNNMTLVSSAVFSSTSNMKDIISAFKQFDVRIIMVAIHGGHGSTMFCEAYKQGLYGSSYVWILAGETMHSGWMYMDKSHGCTVEELTKAIDGHFVLGNMLLSHSETPTVSGKTPEEEMKVLKDMIAVLPSDEYILSRFIADVLDTAWTLAIGLNNSVQHLEKAGLSLHNYTNNKQFLDVLMNGVLSTSFGGLSGPVSFDEAGSRIGLTYITQYFVNESNSKNVALYDLVSDEFTWTVPEPSIWTDGRVPQDRFIYREYFVRTGNAPLVSIITLNCLGLVLSVGLLSFNIYYRNTRSIKMSSPQLNNVIIIGCMVMYTDVFVNTVDSMHPTDSSIGSTYCMARTWLISFGFTLLFGGLFAKTYRVYVMFRNHHIRNKFIKDYHLFAMIGVMLLIDCIILVPWTTFFPLHVGRLSIRTKDTKDDNVIFSEVFVYCYHRLETYWVITMYVYKGLLLVFGVFLAYETRKVAIPELNDSKYIGACIYTVVVICIFGVPLAHVLPIDQRTLKFVLESCLLLFCTTICQCILFIPKIQNRNKVQVQMLQVKPIATVETADKNTVSTNLPIPTDDQDTKHKDTGVPGRTNLGDKRSGTTTVDELERDNKQLQHLLTTETIAVAKLKKAILAISGNIHFYRSGDEYVVFKCDKSFPVGEDFDRLGVRLPGRPESSS